MRDFRKLLQNKLELLERVGAKIGAEHTEQTLH